MVFKNDEELQAYTDWTKSQLQNMAQHIRNSDLFEDEVMGHAVWTLPHRLFIGKAWSRSDRNRAYWVISGVDIPSDHLELDVAETARDAARHFVMKWQLQSARLEQLGEKGDAPGEEDVDWRQVANGLRGQAEGLYGLVEKEEIWRPTEGPLVADA
ncbi:MAG: DUF4826 family protein [Gammaproteobacteria bacterium]